MAEQLIEKTEDEDEADTGRRMDDELKAMSAIIRMLNQMDEPARCRIVCYIAARYTHPH